MIVIDDKIPAIQPNPMFLQLSSKEAVHHLGAAGTINMDKNFINHFKVVERLNQIPSKSWTANAPTSFNGMTVHELNLIAGRTNKESISLGKVKALTEIYTVEDSISKNLDISHLPKQFDWGHVVGAVRNQGNCGSCYIFSTMNMVSARLKIKYGEDITLAVQHPLDCSVFNQGCDGGYPFLVNKFAAEFELVPESCHPYTGKNGKCSDSCDINTLEKIYRVRNYK